MALIDGKLQAVFDKVNVTLGGSLTESDCRFFEINHLPRGLLIKVEIILYRVSFLR